MSRADSISWGGSPSRLNRIVTSVTAARPEAANAGAIARIARNLSQPAEEEWFSQRGALRSVHMRRSIALGLIAITSMLVPAASLAAAAGAVQDGAISGIARDTAGANLVNAGVRVRSASAGHLVSTLTTGSNGAFFAPGLQPGSYVIEALNSYGQVVGVSPIVVVRSGSTASAIVTAPQLPRSRQRTNSFSVFGLGTGASVGVVSAIAAAGITTIAVVANGDDEPNPSPSQ
jgi:Carboxypeptidase regulatory-like domain